MMRAARTGPHGFRLRGLIAVLWRAGLRIHEALALPWLQTRAELPVGPLFCVVNGPTRGRQWSCAAARAELRRTAVAAGVRRRFAPHQLRHAHAVEMAHEGAPLIVIQRQLGHSNLGIPSIYLQGIDNAEIIDAIHGRRAPMIAVSTTLRL